MAGGFSGEGHGAGPEQGTQRQAGRLFSVREAYSRSSWHSLRASGPGTAADAANGGGWRGTLSRFFAGCFWRGGDAIPGAVDRAVRGGVSAPGRVWRAAGPVAESRKQAGSDSPAWVAIVAAAAAVYGGLPRDAEAGRTVPGF